MDVVSAAISARNLSFMWRKIELRPMPSASRVEITAFIDYSTDDGANFTTLISQTATVSTESSTAIQTTMELTKTAFFPAGTSLYFKAKRGVSANSVGMIITANAITKSEIGEDTFIVITKL